MSIETRSSSALFKRAEQLRRWEESDTNREPVSPKQKSRKIKFSSGCVFLAACAAGEKEEVRNLLDKGADIDTANVDGLTALHQACIDDNLDMVEFLVQNKADVNRGDNEGWTPLHATASCGFLSIAKYLIEHGANVAAVNCDGELAVDIAESEAMEDLLKTEVEQQGIDCEKARSEEERMMMRDANEWLSSKSSQVNVGNSKTGATALHVAAAKGYTDVMKILLQCGSDVNKQDVDGWSPLHAAAHWGQKEATELLINNYADMDAQNFVGQTPFDVSDNDMVRYLDFLKKRQIKEDFLRQPKKRQEVQDRPAEAETPTKVKRVEVKIEENEKTEKTNEAETVGMEVSSESETETESSESESESEEANRDHERDDEKKNRVNALNNSEPVHITPKEPEAPIKGPPVIPPKQLQTDNVNSDDNTPSWRRPTGRTNSHSFRDKDVSNENDMTLRRINSFQNDPEFYARYQKLRARIQATSFPSYYHPKISVDKNPFIIPPLSKNTQRQLSNSTSKLDSLESTNVTTSSTTTTSTTNNTATTTTTTSPTKTTTTSPTTSPLPNSVPVRSGLKLAIGETPPPTSTSSTATTPTTTPTTPTGGNRLTMIKNFFKSFVPPVRDEESETQRKAHAKRVRETRRSTQGVTLEEIKSAEQLVKKKNQSVNNNNNNTSEQPGANGDTSNVAVSVTATITTAAPTVITRDTEEPVTTHERRPSWRLRVDNGSKFKLEDATKAEEPPSTPSFVRRTGLQANTTPRPSSAPVETADTTVTLPLRRPKSLEEKEQDKENDARNAQATLATQAAIQRRRRPKRRSTGVVAFDNVDDAESEKDSSGGGGGDYEDSSKMNHQEPVPPTRRRSSSAVRNGSGGNSSPSSSAYNRPRSYVGSNTSPFTAIPSNTPYSSFTPASSYKNYGGYTSNYKSPYFQNGYRDAGGYAASLTIPAKALTNINVVTPNYSKVYDNSRDYVKDSGHRSRQMSRNGSYSRESSLNRPERDSSLTRRSRDSSLTRSQGLSGRSCSLTSLNSEGYISGNDRSSRSSRVSSTNDLILRGENGEIDYKKLYEQTLSENDRLKDKLRKSEEELRDTKSTLEKLTTVTSKNSLSELEKRERRAMERKLSEMEEELKQLQKLKAENERLRAENRALTRVVNKLSISTDK